MKSWTCYPDFGGRWAWQRAPFTLSTGEGVHQICCCQTKSKGTAPERIRTGDLSAAFGEIHIPHTQAREPGVY
jgi:hypothetical protein